MSTCVNDGGCPFCHTHDGTQEGVMDRLMSIRYMDKAWAALNETGQQLVEACLNGIEADVRHDMMNEIMAEKLLMQDIINMREGDIEGHLHPGS